jgi:hypothetical protein
MVEKMVPFDDFQGLQGGGKADVGVARAALRSWRRRGRTAPVAVEAFSHEQLTFAPVPPTDDRHQFGDIYETILADLQSAGNAGEFYTPHAVSQLVARLAAGHFGQRQPPGVAADFGVSGGDGL